MNDASLAADAHKKAEEIRAKLEPEYYDSVDKFYAFSRNADGSQDRAATIYPAVAWWTGRLALPRADAMLDRWASPEFSDRLGNARHQRAHLVLRSHQLSPGFHLAAVHRLGLAGRVSRGTITVRLRTSDAERRTHVGAGSGLGDRIVVGRLVSAAGTQQFAPSLVVGDGNDACFAWTFRLGLGRVASHAAPRAQPSRRVGYGDAAQRAARKFTN